MAKKSSEHGVAKELSFALYGAANRMARMHKHVLDPLGLTFPQYLVMLELFVGTPRSVGDLGTKLGMDTGTITPLLQRMEVAGLVARRRDVEDERRVLVNLSKAGVDMRPAILQVSGKIKSACKLSDTDMEELRAALDAYARPPHD